MEIKERGVGSHFSSPAPHAEYSRAGVGMPNTATNFSRPNFLTATGPPTPQDFGASGGSSVSTSSGAITFEEVVERYHGKVFQLIFRYTGDYEEACDLTQDTFVRAYRAWNEFRGDSQIYTWLYRIALNLCHNSRKKGDRKRRVEGVSLDISPGMDEDRPTGLDVADARPQPAKSVENDELRARLHDALAALPENYRIVIVLRDIEGLPYEEIARITDSTLEAIKSRLFRARTMLREMLAPYLFGSSVEPESTSVPSGSRRFSWKKALRHDKKRQEKL